MELKFLALKFSNQEAYSGWTT